MKLLQTVFVFTLMLFVSTGFAAKKEKTLICHVGSELGSNDESYQDNPNCDVLPPYDGDPADYICPDAGKVDLIAVSKNAKHIGNPAHYFMDSGGFEWEDYLPEEDVGDEAADFEDANFDGIDDGCELEVPQTCPCWTADEIASIDGFAPDGTALLVQTFDDGKRKSCFEFGWDSSADNHQNKAQAHNENLGPDSGLCTASRKFNFVGDQVIFRYYGDGDIRNTLTLDQLDACNVQAADCVDRNTP